MIKAFEQSDFLDCRVNAYRSYTEYKGINRKAPNFIFIHLDRSTSNTERAHRMTLSNTLRDIKDKLAERYPIVLRSENGYHVYQPIDAFISEEEEVFSSNFDQPSKVFLKFAEQYLSNNKSNLSHNPSLKSCMIRIPGSFNYKCILEGKDPEVRIIQRWDGQLRPKINLLLGSFHAYLVDQRIKELQTERKELKVKYQIRMKKNNNNTFNITAIPWIELLLETPIEDYKKNGLNLILTPYLINVKKLPYDDAFNIIDQWVNKSDSIKRLDSNFNYLIKYALENSIKKGYLPMNFETLKEKNRALYDPLNINEQ
jgi:hypothetical protein